MEHTYFLYSSVSLLGLLLLSIGFVVARIVHKLWLNPIRLQRMMASQGIKSPPYRFLHGNTKELLQIRKEAKERPAKFGLSHDILPIIQPEVHTWVNTYGPNYLMWVGPEPQLVVTDTELIKEILNNKDNNYSKVKPRLFLKKLMGDGLVVSEGAKWVKLRKLANHAFHGESLKDLVPAFVESVHMMLEKWKGQDDKELEVYEEFTFLTSEIISRTAFGSSYVEGRKIFDMLKDLSVLTIRNAFKVRIPGVSLIWKTADELQAKRLERGVCDAVVKIIKKREEKIATGDLVGFGNDFLGLLMHAYLDENWSERITINDLVDECKVFYIAGQETTSAMLSWTLFLLAVHTDWQDEARNEVLDVFGRNDPNYDELTRLKTMTMIINESLRLYSPSISLMRKVKRHGRLGRLVVPADLIISIANQKVNHDPHIWGEGVHCFRPERFSEGIANATGNNPAAYFPFGLGHRHCVGMNFAITEAKIALSMILQRYSFTLSPAYVHSPTQVVTLYPKHGVQVILHRLH